jgi:THO complex subunit 2 N-terminus
MSSHIGFRSDEFLSRCLDDCSQSIAKANSSNLLIKYYMEFIIAFTYKVLIDASERESWPYALPLLMQVYNHSYHFFQEFAFNNSFACMSLSEILCDLFWLIDAHHAQQNPTLSPYLTELLSCTIDAHLVQVTDATIYLDAEMLVKANLIASKEIFQKKLIRLNTSLLYKQQRYNLLFEDTEGFSLVIFVLKQRSKTLFIDLMKLLGSFDLEANRIIDLIFGEWLFDPKQFESFYLPILKDFKNPHLSNIIGHKISTLKDSYTVQTNLIFIGALLIRSELVSLDDILLFIDKKDGILLTLVKSLFEVGLLKKGLALWQSFSNLFPNCGNDIFFPLFQGVSLYIHSWYFLSSVENPPSLTEIEAASLYSREQLINWNDIDRVDWRGFVFSIFAICQPCQHVVLLTKILHLALMEINGAKEQKLALSTWLGFIKIYIYALF